MVSTTLEGGWRVAVGNEVPYSLKEYKGKKKSKKGKDIKKISMDMMTDLKKLCY